MLVQQVIFVLIILIHIGVTNHKISVLVKAWYSVQHFVGLHYYSGK